MGINTKIFYLGMLFNNYHPSNLFPLKFADGLMIMQFCNRVNNTDCWYAYERADCSQEVFRFELTFDIANTIILT